MGQIPEVDSELLIKVGEVTRGCVVFAGLSPWQSANFYRLGMKLLILETLLYHNVVLFYTSYQSPDGKNASTSPSRTLIFVPLLCCHPVPTTNLLSSWLQIWGHLARCPVSVPTDLPSCTVFPFQL